MVNSKISACKMEGKSFSLDKGKSINETSNLAFLGGSKCKDSIASSTWSLKAVGFPWNRLEGGE